MDFGSLELIPAQWDSFIGIQRTNNKLRFLLPRGVDATLYNTFNAKRQLFCLFYEVVRKFVSIAQNNSRMDRDGLPVNREGGRAHSTDANKHDVQYYSKLNALGKVLDSYDELAILAVTTRTAHVTDAYDHLHKHLHQGIYFPDNSVHVEYMDVAKRQVMRSETDIVELYCFILWDINNYLTSPASTHSLVSMLANSFRYKHLTGSESSLFEEFCFAHVMEKLKGELDRIDRTTTCKSDTYYHFYDAVYKFLYSDVDGTDGNLFGLRNFYSVWEAMCQTVLLTQQPSGVLYVDNRRQYLSDSSKQLYDQHQSEWKRTLESEFMRCKKYPDLVMSVAGAVCVVDMKYIEVGGFMSKDTNSMEEMKKRSVRKQFEYESIVHRATKKLNGTSPNIWSRFMIPGTPGSTEDAAQINQAFMGGYIKLDVFDPLEIMRQYLQCQ